MFGRWRKIAGLTLCGLFLFLAGVLVGSRYSPSAPRTEPAPETGQATPLAETGQTAPPKSQDAPDHPEESTESTDPKEMARSSARRCIVFLEETLELPPEKRDRKRIDAAISLLGGAVNAEPALAPEAAEILMRYLTFDAGGPGSTPLNRRFPASNVLGLMGRFSGGRFSGGNEVGEVRAALRSVLARAILSRDVSPGLLSSECIAAERPKGEERLREWSLTVALWDVFGDDRWYAEMKDEAEKWPDPEERERLFEWLRRAWEGTPKPEWFSKHETVIETLIERQPKEDR